MIPTKDMTPHVPVTPEEIARDVLRCAEAGITSVHLHARDESGRPTHRKAIYGEIIGRIRDQREDLVIGVSCSGRDVQEIERRAEVLELTGDLKPDLASLTTSSLNFARQASMNAPDVVRGLAERMREAGITPELEIFDLGMANVVRYLAERGVLSAPFHANVFFGNVATAQADLMSMAALANALPAGTSIAFGGIGDVQHDVMASAVAHGFGVRIGIEDNIYADPRRTELATNPGHIEWVHGLIKHLGREVESPAAFRERVCR